VFDSLSLSYSFCNLLRVTELRIFSLGDPSSLEKKKRTIETSEVDEKKNLVDFLTTFNKSGKSQIRRCLNDEALEQPFL
jgi:hypothetical protein